VTRQASAAWVLSREEERLRPLYSRLLGLRHVNPGGLLCFVFFEGAISLAVLLGLAELVSWWAVLLLPASVAVMVKVNDEVAAAVARSAARVPELERARFRRELEPAIGRAPVPEVSTALALRPAGTAPAGADATSGGPVRRRGGWLAIVRARRGLTLALPRGRGGEATRAITGGPAGTGKGPTGGRAELSRARPSEPGSGDRSYQSGRCPLNTHPLERLEKRPPWQWPPGLDQPDSPRQRTRQSGKRRYK
jgi:hypothetical protein